jgi:DNA-binding response OmpR family regulator
VGEILLIAADWRLRALVRAQLLEEGYAVNALPSLELALATLIRGGEQPGLTILDMQGIEIQVRALSELWRLTGEAPLFLCGGAFGRAELSQEGMPPAQVLLRPFRVGDLVEQVRKVLGCPGDNPTTKERSLELG